MKKRLLALFMVMVLCMVMVLTGCKNNAKTEDNEQRDDKKSEVVLSNAIEKTLDAMFNGSGDNASASVLDRVISDGGKITVTLSDQLKNVLYLDQSKNSFANNFSMSAEGQSLNLGIYGKGNEFAVAAPELLGDTVYGVNMDTMMSDLKGSAIWSLLGTDYDTFVSQYGDQIEQLVGLVEGIGGDATSEMAEELMNNISEILKNVETATEKSEVEIYGEKIEATVVTYHMEQEDIEALMDVTINWMENVITSISSDMEDLIEVNGSSIEGLDELFVQMRAEMDAAFESIEVKGDFYVYINTESECIMQAGVRVTITSDKQTGNVDMAFVLGEDPGDSNKYALVMKSEVGDETNTMEISLSIDEQKAGDVVTTTYTLAVDAAGEKQEFALVFAHDQKAGKYTLTLVADGEAQFTASGELELSDDLLRFSIDEWTAGSETSALGLAVTIETDISDMPEMPAYSNVLKLTEDELMELVESLGLVMPDYPDTPDYPDDEDENASTDNTVSVGSGALKNGAVTVYDANGVKVVFTGLTKDSYGDYRLKYKVTNNTKGDIAFSTDNCIVNGVTMNLFIYETVEAGDTVTGEEYIYAEVLDVAGISSIRNIKCYDGEIVDVEDFEWEYAVGFELDCGNMNYIENADVTGNVVYSGNGIKLINKGFKKNAYGDASAMFLLVNDREDHISVALDDVVANGIETDKFAYGYAYAGTVSYVEFYWFEDEISDLGGNLKSLTFSLAIEDMLTYKEYADDIEVSFAIR